jgi:hypothetical protein
MSSPNSRLPCALLKSRKTVPLTGTAAKVQASLDFRSTLALSYATEWLKRASGGLQAPSSGVIRRALALYVQHLTDKGSGGALDEFKAVQRACQTSSTPQEDQEAASERLEGFSQAEPLPTFQHVLYGPQWASECAAAEARHAQLIAHTAPYQQRRGDSAA